MLHDFIIIMTYVVIIILFPAQVVTSSQNVLR